MKWAACQVFQGVSTLYVDFKIRGSSLLPTLNEAYQPTNKPYCDCYVAPQTLSGIYKVEYLPCITQAVSLVHPSIVQDSIPDPSISYPWSQTTVAFCPSVVPDSNDISPLAIVGIPQSNENKF